MVNTSGITGFIGYWVQLANKPDFIEHVHSTILNEISIFPTVEDVLTL